MIDTIFFDLDGTLVDTERLYIKANVQAAAALGIRLPESAFLPLVGASGAAFEQVVTDLVGAGNRQAFGQLTEAAVAKYLASGQPIACPQAESTLKTLQQAGYQLGIVTASSPAHLNQVLAATGWAHYLTWQITMTKARPKPAPDLYLDALKVSRVDPKSALAVEDTPIGVAAAIKAGITCIQVVDLAPKAKQASGYLSNLGELPGWLLQFA